MRQTSPSRGGTGRLPEARLFHGKAISAVQPSSMSAGLLSVPWTWTAARNPGRSQSMKAQRRPRGCLP